MPIQSGPGAPVPYRVTSNQPAQGRLPSGAYGPGHQVTIVLENGSAGQVFIPNEVYGNIDMVKAILAEKAASIDAVDKLTGIG